MRRNRLIRKKPKIFDDKIKLAFYIKDKWNKLEYEEKRGCYWYGVFENSGRKIYIFLQHYVSSRRALKSVDEIHIRHKDTSKALTVREVRELLAEFNLI
ncbi:MAG: hypothetical protein M0R03_17150 [Novosphingobium sp.]|nr:hypothetical protein [Novosphingobium sp.]